MLISRARAVQAVLVSMANMANSNHILNSKLRPLYYQKPSAAVTAVQLQHLHARASSLGAMTYNWSI
jgi:hypothetical protein